MQVQAQVPHLGRTWGTPTGVVFPKQGLVSGLCPHLVRPALVVKILPLAHGSYKFRDSEPAGVQGNRQPRAADQHCRSPVVLDTSSLQPFVSHGP